MTTKQTNKIIDRTIGKWASDMSICVERHKSLEKRRNANPFGERINLELMAKAILFNS